MSKFPEQIHVVIDKDVYPPGYLEEHGTADEDRAIEKASDRDTFMSAVRYNSRFWFGRYKRRVRIATYKLVSVRTEKPLTDKEIDLEVPPRPRRAQGKSK